MYSGVPKPNLKSIMPLNKKKLRENSSIRSEGRFVIHAHDLVRVLDELVHRQRAVVPSSTNTLSVTEERQGVHVFKSLS